MTKLGARPHDTRAPDAVGPAQLPVRASDVLHLVQQATSLLFVNAETTQQTVASGERIAGVLGQRATVIPRWDELAVQVETEQGSQQQINPVAPVAIDMNKVMATERVVDSIAEGRVTAEEAESALRTVAALPPVSLARFVLAAAVGACALAVVFGAQRPSTFALIAFSAGTGALLRRGLSHLSSNPFVQPFAAALLAGLIGGLGLHYQLGSAQTLIALTPCMVLVPGPHFLNGLIDLTRGRVALGSGRVLFACLVIVAISAGLLLGLRLMGSTLPLTPPSRSIPLGVDAIAAGFAVAAYASFYSMHWRYIPIPVVVGMAAHALRWSAIATGATAFGAAFLACLLVGTVMSPVARRLRQPFAAMSFAAVVSLIPGVFLFRMAAGLVQLAELGTRGPDGLVSIVLTDGATATLIFLSMGFGLILPRLLDERFLSAAASRADVERAEHVRQV
jgi:uncharacterized membrane protein YjjP (DUF1212 family)